MGFPFHFSSLYPAQYIELYVCQPIQVSYLNFRAVLVLPKTTGTAQTHKSMSFNELYGALYMYISVITEKFHSKWDKIISEGAFPFFYAMLSPKEFNFFFKQCNFLDFFFQNKEKNCYFRRILGKKGNIILKYICYKGVSAFFVTCNFCFYTQ